MGVDCWRRLQRTGPTESRNHPDAKAIRFDVKDESVRSAEVSKADIVISFLPAHLHVPVATECVKQGKHLVTASYVSKEMSALDEKQKKQE